MIKNIKRVLIYTHNTIGIGHVIRVLSIITGIRKIRPGIEFLVLSGTSIPQIFYTHNIELIKLPSLQSGMNSANNHFKPRYLNSMSIESILKLRQTIILDCFKVFRPDIVFIEHKISGLLEEASCLISQKEKLLNSKEDFLLIHLSRGLQSGLLNIPISDHKYSQNSLDYFQKLYDYFFLFEDRDMLKNLYPKEFDFISKDKIHCFGKITIKTVKELLPRTRILNNFRIPDKPIILISLGRAPSIISLLRLFISYFQELKILSSYNLLFVIDPYLSEDLLAEIKQLQKNIPFIFIPFTQFLVDLINIADLMICRAGYNTIAELLLTGTKAIIIPEKHGSHEQEIRAQSLYPPNLLVLPEKNIKNKFTFKELEKLLKRDKKPRRMDFNKYRIAEQIMQVLEKRNS